MKYLMLFTMLIFIANAQEELTAEDAVRIGLANNYTIQIARNDQQIAENSTGYGRANFLPSLAITGAHRYTKSDIDSDLPALDDVSENLSTSGQIALNWTIFDGFRMFADYRRYRELANLGKYQTRFTIENTVISILSSYYNLIQQEQLLDVARDALSVSKTRLNKEQVRKDLGSVSSTDFLDAQVAYNNDKSVYINQDLLVLIARQDFNVLLAREPTVPVSVKKEIQIPPLSLSYEEIKNLALEQNSEISIYRQDNLIGNRLVTIGRSAFYPHLSFSSSYGYSDRENIPEKINTRQKDLVLGLNLTFNLFNGWSDRITLQNAKIEARSRELALQDIMNRVNKSVSETYETYQKILELVSNEETNVRAAVQNLELQSDRYQIGAATSLELRDAQLNVVRARSALIAVKYQARIARIAIDQLTGQITVE